MNFKRKNTFGKQSGQPKAPPEPKKEPRKVQFGRQAPATPAAAAPPSFPVGVLGAGADLQMASKVVKAYNECTDAQKKSMQLHIQKAMAPVIARLDDIDADILREAFDLAGEQFKAAAEAAEGEEE